MPDVRWHRDYALLSCGRPAEERDDRILCTTCGGAKVIPAVDGITHEKVECVTIESDENSNEEVKARSGYKCNGCRQMQKRHEVIGGQFMCKNGRPSPGFAIQRTQPGRVSQSFDLGEIDFLDDLFEALLRDGDLSTFASHPGMSPVYRKIVSMRKKSEESLIKES